jgi:hypothetical protein
MTHVDLQRQRHQLALGEAVFRRVELLRFYTFLSFPWLMSETSGRDLPYKGGKSCMLSVGQGAVGSAAYSPTRRISILTAASIQAISE